MNSKILVFFKAAPHMRRYRKWRKTGNFYVFWLKTINFVIKCHKCWSNLLGDFDENYPTFADQNLLTQNLPS